MQANERLARDYIAAWNARDARAIRATFAHDGTYRDPVSGSLPADAVGEYARGLWESFPDLAFEAGGFDVAGDSVVVEWVMRGTNTGPFQQLPPCGRAISLDGVDVIRCGPDGIVSVTGYFDSAAIPRQLGLQVLVQPDAAGPFRFGNAVCLAGGSTARPGAFSITAIWNAEEENEAIRDFSTRTAVELQGMQGFIGIAFFRIGDRGVTIAAWEHPDDVRRISASPAHRDAMGRFWQDLGRAAFTSVWVPERINPLWVRCDGCRRMVDVERSAGTCSCGEAVADPPPWF